MVEICTQIKFKGKKNFLISFKRYSMMITSVFLDGLVAASWEFLSAPAIETVASTTIKFRSLLN